MNVSFLHRFVCPQKTSISSHGCLMQSTFYGPNSRGCIELRVLGDTIPGCSVKVHCIQVLTSFTGGGGH